MEKNSFLIFSFLEKKASSMKQSSSTSIPGIEISGIQGNLDNRSILIIERDK